MRGVAGTTRATRFGRVKDYAKRAHEEICVLVQVETEAALDNIEAICAIDGVDGVFIGPADLHASMGYTGEIANPKVKPLIDEAIRRIRKCGKAPGILTPNEADARHWLECGALFVAVGADVGILARGAEALAAKFKVMKPEIIITARGHAGTMATLQAEFTAPPAVRGARPRRLPEAARAQRCAASPPSARCRSTAS